MSSVRRRLALALALCVASVGVATGIEHLLDADFGIDKLLSNAPTTGSGSPGRMAPTTAFCLAGLGCSLALIDARARVLRIVVHGGLLAAAVVALATLVAYLFSTVSGDGLFHSYTEMAFHTALAMSLSVVGILHCRPHRGVMVRATAGTLGGAAFRRIIPIAIGVPILVGWLTLGGVRLDYYDLELGMAIFAVVMVCCFSGLVWWVSGTVDSADLHRRQADEMRRLVRFDELSGLFNRRHLDESLDEECRRAARYGRDVSILMLDIDHFEDVNKRLGHPVGDWVIRQVAHVMTDMARDIDITGRYGGDEFMLVLPETNANGAAILAERLRAAIEECQFGARQLPTPVTISLGVFTPARAEEYAPEVVIANVEAALLEAKVQGQNRVVVARSAGPADRTPVASGQRSG